MPSAAIDNPILNSPFAEPARHWALDDSGLPTGRIAPGRRRSEFVLPVPPPSHKGQAALDLDDQYGERKPNDEVNRIRAQVGAWRALGDAGLRAVTPVTARLLRHWRDPARSRRLFFCQIEAAETAIWLAEVAPKAERDRLYAMIEGHSPGLKRIAFKLATGAGKTTVMAMLIAWQVLNAAQSRSKQFADAFLIVAPGITVRDRLRVLLPSDPTNTYDLHEIVPPEMRADLHRAAIVITNFHAFQRRDDLDAPKLTREVLGEPGKPMKHLESDGRVMQRACKDLLGTSKRVVVLNDEAHHCYREKPAATAPQKLDAEERSRAKKSLEAARLWISGIEMLQRVRGQPVTVYDLSATPFFLRGSGYDEGTLFPWVLSDFSLIDAIECGIVKVPRVPIQDLRGADEPIYRHVYKHVREELSKSGRGKQTEARDPEKLPAKLAGALTILHDKYRKKSADWARHGLPTPPVFIVVCNNTATSKWVYDWIAGYERTERLDDGTERIVTVPGHLDLLSNTEQDGTGQPRLSQRPKTILIDSEELESGDALSDSFRKLAAPEIDAFKRDLRARGLHADADALTDADLLREVMNTVGQVGRLGEPIRCVVSVSMLTEGWDARTVTHVLGVRAFGTQLLCEQVVGRALRRVSYEAVAYDENGHGLFAPEEADVLGIPFSFMPANSASAYVAPKKLTHVHAVPERRALEVAFPRVVGYRTVLPPGRLVAHFTRDSRFAITPDMAPPEAVNAAIVGPEVTLSLDELRHQRDATVAFHLAGHTLRTWFRDEADALKPWLFPSLLAITRRWMAECLEVAPSTFSAYLMWRSIGDHAAERIFRACVPTGGGEGATLRPIMAPSGDTGSSRHINFTTTKSNFWTPRADRCQTNLVVCDGDWEAAAAQELDGLAGLLRYVKNDRLGFEVPYVHGGTEHLYRPDFIAVIDDGRGEADPLHLVIEMKGERDAQDDAKHDTMRRLWVPAVNATGRFGRWDFVRLDGPYGVAELIARHLA